KGPVGTRRDQKGPVGTRRDHLEQGSDQLGLEGTKKDQLGPEGTTWNREVTSCDQKGPPGTGKGPVGTRRDQLEQGRDQLGPERTSLNREGTSWDRKGPTGTGKGPAGTRKDQLEQGRDQLGPEGTSWNGEGTSWNGEGTSWNQRGLAKTLLGFVREDPTASIRLKQRPALQCLNEFCRLGCVCLSLSHCFRASHCGRPACMLGCSCLKQKVVILRNMDSSASDSASSPSKTKKKKKRVIMKMAYVLKEADTAASPAEQIRTLWRRNAHGPDSEPVHMPDVAPVLRPVVRRKRPSSCARVRGFLGRKQKEGSRKLTLTRHEAPKLPRHGQQSSTDVDPPRPCSDADPAPGSDPPSPSEERHPKPSKRLLIVADCKWGGDSERSYVLKKLCEAMALDNLDRPFWIRKYLITPVDQTVDDSSGNRCIQYKVHISTPLVKEQAPPTGNPGSHGGEQAVRAAAEHGQEGSDGSTGSDPDKKSGFPQKNEEPPADRNTNQTLTETVEDWQWEVTEEEEIPMEEEEGPMEDWQEEITEDDLLEDVGDFRHSPIREELRTEGTAELNQVKEVESAVPLLTRVPPNGFLLAKKKQPGGSDEVIQVNGKPYPFAKIQLGRMGALHPANRLAAYLTGRVRSQTQRQPSSLSCRPQSTPSVTSSAVCAPPAPTARIQTQPTASSPSAGPPNVLHLLAPLPPCIRLPGPKVVPEPAQPSSGIRYYRRPDGSLVQLIPINRSTIQGESPRPAPSVSWSQQSSFPTKVVPANRLQDPIILQLPFLPPTKPVAPEGGLLQTQGQTPRVLPVQSPVYQQADMVDRSDMVAEDMTVQKQGVSDQLSIHTPAECARTRGDPRPRPMPDGYSSEQDCVSDPEDLDIVCVEQMEVVDLLSSSETDNSSDFGDSEAEDERGLAADKQPSLPRLFCTATNFILSTANSILSAANAILSTANASLCKNSLSNANAILSCADAILSFADSILYFANARL
ncbi:PREDICTED: uncharacterized protein LOC107081029, partial [Cyprinodon variegatus]|uniref:uncharacterized protein LOC107081029 n=1 Tax=Cyprinodon variegatus TaxID=28743 RepID=UPI0007427193